MVQPRPSCTLIMDIDESLDTEQTRLEVARCYTHVGQALIRPHESAEGAPQENTVRLLAKLGNRDYLHSSDEGADELWDNVMERWFYNQFHNVGNNMVIYNKRQEEVGNPELFFDWLEIELQNGELYVRLHLDSNSNVEPGLSKYVTRARNVYNTDLLGEDVTRISMPAPASYEKQREKGLAEHEIRIREQELAKKEAEEAAGAAKEEAAREAEENFLGTPDETEEDRTAAEDAEYRARLDERYGIPEPDFDLDYTIWEIEYADGAKRVFDSEKKEFVD